MSVASPSRAAFPPLISGGSASATSLSRPAQASLELRPVGSLNRPRRPLSQGFDPSGYPDKPPASYQIKPTTVWVVPSSTSDTRLLGARGVEKRRGGLGPVGITPFPLPAHQTGRADFPHPASRPASPQSTRRWAKMDPTSSDHTELPERDRIGETLGASRRHLVAPDQEMTYSLVRSSSLIPDNQFGSPAPPSP